MEDRREANDSRSREGHVRIKGTSMKMVNGNEAVVKTRKDGTLIGYEEETHEPLVWTSDGVSIVSPQYDLVPEMVVIGNKTINDHIRYGYIQVGDKKIPTSWYDSGYVVGRAGINEYCIEPWIQPGKHRNKSGQTVDVYDVTDVIKGTITFPYGVLHVKYDLTGRLIGSYDRSFDLEMP